MQTLYKTLFSRRVAENDRAGATEISISSHIDRDTLMLRSGDIARIWKVGGISHEGAEAEDIQIRMDALNVLYRSLSSSTNIALWVHNVRRRITDRLDADIENGFCRKLNDKYYDSFSGYRMMSNELYLTAIYRPFTSKAARNFHKAGRSLEDIEAAIREALRIMNDIGNTIESSMKLYDVETLGIYLENGIKFSRATEFLAYLINGKWQKIPVPKGPLYAYIQTNRIFIGNEIIEIRMPDGTGRYASMLDIKDFPDTTEPGKLNLLLYEDYEYIFTQSLSFMAKRDAQKMMSDQQKRLMNTEDAAGSQIVEISEALDDLVSGRISLGEYHSSLLIYGETIDILRKNVASAVAALGDQGFLCASVTLHLDPAFWAQLPGNWDKRGRVVPVSSRNFAGLASFHNFATGKRDGNPWGQAVSILKTENGQPYYFNFHASKEEEDNRDQKLLGNTKIIGQSGSGKTVLLGFLLAQALKYNPTVCAFDKDRGIEILIRAIGGKYLAIANGKPTGFNPLQQEPTETNILFCEALIRKLATEGGRTITTQDEQDISHAVRTVMAMPRELRRLTVLRQNFIDRDEESISKRLAKWCEGGPFGWVLDNPDDQLDFTTHKVYGFDGTAFLDNEAVRTPIAMYLLHRMESIIDGRRFIYIMDEFWKWLLDSFFSEFAYNKQKTIRKLDGFGIFATQSPSDVLSSPISRAIIEQCATDIYLPNPKADRDEYVTGFKITDREFEMIKHFPEDSRLMLIKQGHKTAVARLDLKGFNDELVVLSGSADNVALLDDIMREVGEDPDIWLPMLQDCVRKRREKR
jgi:type IV secretion/conjugal transfer VirB4 family ATPase